MTMQWHPPGVGLWKRDDAHVTSVMTGFLDDVFVPAQQQGFREGFASFGVMLTGFDIHYIAGRPYMRPRIAGAPPQPIWGDTPPAKRKSPGKPPPRFVFKLLFALHPELRRRARRSAEVWNKRVWRDVTRRWHDELRPRFIAHNLELTRTALPALDDHELARHVDAVTDAFREMVTQHFLHASMQVLVIGDFIVRVAEWTRASASEVLATLQGASPASSAAAAATASIAGAIAKDASLRAIVESDRAPQQIVDALTGSGTAAGRALVEYLEVYGLRPLSGLDLHGETLLDRPELVVRALRAALARREPPANRAEALAAELRARMPEAHRADFDDAYGEARLIYGVRDDDVGVTLWRLGLVRRAVREAVRRLAARGALHDPVHGYDAKRAELVALLRGDAGPSADELRARAARRAELDALEPPFELGEEGPMPAPECFPPAVARSQRAVVAFLAAMEGGSERDAGATVRGTGASAGVYEGRARLVRGLADFTRIEAGDILIARFTSPAYNVLLPLTGAIVTERGGLLSHAAIVAREYGIPAVVATSDALSRIPDGARVRVDGTRGVVEVLAAATDAREEAAPRAAAAPAFVPPPAPATAGAIVPLRDATGAAFGGKAKALAAVIAAKLPVPDGVALDADLVEHVVRGDADARERVRAACSQLPAPWAVRSSAIGEDSAQASFAGQHATLLGVQPDKLFDAIASVFASAHTDAALGYRKRMGITGMPRMGVVVQTLLRPDISGVLFSRDPTAAREGRVIEATWGLGEALVAGLVTPDRYRIGADGKVLDRTIGDKDVAIEAREDGGTAEVAIAGERARAACLDDARLAELAQLASRCEQVFGGPQDLEWAVANGRLHLLQSRPVTTGARS